MTLEYNTHMPTINLACLNNDQKIKPFLGPNFASVVGEPYTGHSVTNQSIKYKDSLGNAQYFSLYNELTTFHSLNLS